VKTFDGGFWSPISNQNEESYADRVQEPDRQHTYGKQNVGLGKPKFFAIHPQVDGKENTDQAYSFDAGASWGDLNRERWRRNYLLSWVCVDIQLY
jgi:hypothetical protein